MASSVRELRVRSRQTRLFRRACQYHRHDRVCRCFRLARRIHRAGLAQQPGEHASEESRREQATDDIANCRRRKASAAFRYRAQCINAPGGALALKRLAERRLCQDPGHRIRRASRRSFRNRSERTGARAQDHRAGPARHLVCPSQAGHEGRDHSRQRRRRRRRLRAAGRSRGCRSHSPG